MLIQVRTEREVGEKDAWVDFAKGVVCVGLPPSNSTRVKGKPLVALVPLLFHPLLLSSGIMTCTR
jgi:hypothetical protein